MKRKMAALFAMSLGGTLLLPCSGMYAAAEDLNADTVIQRAGEAAEAAENYAADVSVNCLMSINVGEDGVVSQIAIAAGADFRMECMENPLAMSLDGAFSVSTLGESTDLAIKVYVVPDDSGNYSAYIYTEDSSEVEGSGGEWQAGTISGEDLALVSFATDEGTDTAGISFVLEDGTTDCDGKDCYLLTSVVDPEAFSSYLLETTGEDILTEAGISESDVQDIVEKLDVNVEYYINAETYEPVLLHADLNGSDFSFLNEYIAASLGDEYETVEATFDDLSFDVEFSFGSVEEITVPEEALLAAEYTGETETEGTDEYSSVYSVETTDDEVPEELISSIEINGSAYSMPLDYDLLTQAGWYTTETDETYTLEMVNDAYPNASFYVQLLSEDGYDYFMPADIVGQKAGSVELISWGDPGEHEATNLTFGGIGIGSSWEDVIGAFGLPNYCFSLGFGDTEAAYEYTLYSSESGYYYTLEFYIDTNGEVCMIDMGVY